MMTAMGLWMRCSSRKRKTSGCGADICFSCGANEQTSDAIGQKARQRGFASGHTDIIYTEAAPDRDRLIYEVWLMGIYLNPGNGGFWQAIRSEIYVDKTGLITLTNKYANTRRFGKSMALNMLAAYYSRGCDSADLFNGLQIEKDASFREHLNQHDVIFLNMQQFLIRAKKYMRKQAISSSS